MENAVRCTDLDTGNGTSEKYCSSLFIYLTLLLPPKHSLSLDHDGPFDVACLVQQENKNRSFQGRDRESSERKGRDCFCSERLKKKEQEPKSSDL